MTSAPVHPRRRRQRRQWRRLERLGRLVRSSGPSQRGSASVFIVGMAVTLLACAGLVVDGGIALNARMKLADDAEQAARLGAQQVDVDLLRGSGVLRIDPVAAQARAGSYMSALGYQDVSVQVSPAGDEVSVGATDVERTKMISLIGINSFNVSASATANAVTQ